MRIDTNEVLSVEELGELDGSPIKALHYKGGWVMGVKSAGENSQVLATASHIGLLRHAIKKANPSFQASLMKSESNETEIINYSHLLPLSLTKSGYGLHAVYDTPTQIEFMVTKHDLRTYSVVGLKKSDTLELKNRPLKDETGKPFPKFNHTNQVAPAIMKAAIEEANKANQSYVEIENKILPIKDPNK